MLDEDLGSTTAGTLDASGVRLILGTRPLAYDLRALRKQAGVEDTEYKLYRLFQPWLVVHHIGVISAVKSRPVLAIRYEADFGSAPVTTIGLSPDRVMKTSELGTMTFSSTVEGNGHLRVGGETSSAVRLLPLGGGLKLGLGSSLTLEGSLALCKRHVPLVHGAGLGSTRCEWYFRSDGEPLAGSQTMAQVLLAPKGTDSLELRVRGEIVLGSAIPGLVTSKSTPWVDVTCQLLRA
jgi:hypothetical protein